MTEPVKKSAIEYRADSIKRRNRFATVSVIIGLILVCFSYYFFQIFYTSNVDTKDRPTFVYVHRGDNWQKALRATENTEAIIDRLSLYFVGKLMGYNKPGAVKPGRYELQTGMTNRQVINLLKSGRQTPLRLTFTNVRLRRELATKLSKQIDAKPKQIDSLLSSPSYTKSLGFDTTTVLSMFIPNTYELYWNTSAQNLMQRMKTEYEKFWTPERDEARQKLGLTRVSTLASIVEAEQQQHADERPRIAGVYLNRLKRGMKLQADPTVVYANGDFGIKRVLNVHLQKDSPYNTYMYGGLPPGPIDLPSIASINAVLHPEQNDYLYFCAKDDFSGYHAFVVMVTKEATCQTATKRFGRYKSFFHQRDRRF
jgi:UPF0755 protein